MSRFGLIVLALWLSLCSSLHAQSADMLAGRSLLGSAKADTPLVPLPDPKAEAAERQRQIEKLRAEQAAAWDARVRQSAAYQAVETQILDALVSGADASGLIMQARSTGRPDPDPLPVTRRFAGLARVLDEFDRAVKAYAEDARTLDAAGAKTLEFAGKRIEAEQLLVLDRLARWAEARGEAERPWLHLGARALERVAQYRQLYAARFAQRNATLHPLRAALKTVAADSTKASSDRAHTLLSNWAPLSAEADAPPILGLDLPVSRPRFAPVPLPAGPEISPSYASTAPQAPQAADLGNQPGAELSDSILAKAAELEHEYTRIHDFVRSVVHTDWYAGSMRGAAGTLRDLRGNDVDQALLLAALLRASGAPTRLVSGTLEVPLDQLAAQLGVSDGRVGAALVAAGVAAEPVIRGGRVAAYRIAHTWVSTFVPITNYRGSSVSDAGRTWIPLAPALKPYRHAAGQDPLARTAISVDAFIDGWLQTPAAERSPWEQLREQLNQALGAQSPPLTLESQQRVHALDAPALALLPLSLPADKARVYSESASHPQTTDQTVRVRVLSGTDPGATVSLDYTAPMRDWLGQRVTLSYSPATEDDDALRLAYGGLGQTPPFLIRVRPQLSLNGVPLRYGERELLPGTPQIVEIELGSPAGSRMHRQTVLAGGYAALVLAGPGDTPQLQAPDAQITGDSEYTAARLLHNLGSRYLADWNRADLELGNTLGAALIHPLPSLVLVLNQQQAVRVDGLITDLPWKGVAIDAALRPVEPIASSSTRERDFMRLSALTGSRLESLVFERQWAVDAISADKGLALARAANIPILSLESGADLSALTIDASSKAAIQAQLAAGYRVTVPQNPLTRGAWTGATWRTEDPSTGAAGWFISGSYAGAATTPPPELWFLEGLREQLQDPYAAPANEDPNSAAYIVIDKLSQDQIGSAGAILDRDLIAVVIDPSGRPVHNVPLSFSVKSGDAKLLFGGNAAQQMIEVSDSRGRAKVRVQLQELLGSTGKLLLTQSVPVPIFHAISLLEIKITFGDRVLLSGEDYRLLARANAASTVEYNPPPSTHLAPNQWPVQIIPGVYQEWRGSTYLPGFAQGLFNVVVRDIYSNRVDGHQVGFSAFPIACRDLDFSATNPELRECPCNYPGNPKFYDPAMVPDGAGLITSLSQYAQKKSLLYTRYGIGANAVYIPPALFPHPDLFSGFLYIAPRNLPARFYMLSSLQFDLACGDGTQFILTRGVSHKEMMPPSSLLPVPREIDVVKYEDVNEGPQTCNNGPTGNNYGYYYCHFADAESEPGYTSDTNYWRFEIANGEAIEKRIDAIPIDDGSMLALSWKVISGPSFTPVSGSVTYEYSDSSPAFVHTFSIPVIEPLRPSVDPPAVATDSFGRLASNVVATHRASPQNVPAYPLELEFSANDFILAREELPGGLPGSTMTLLRGTSLESELRTRAILNEGSPYRIEGPWATIPVTAGIVSGFGLKKDAHPETRLALIGRFPDDLTLRRDVDVGRQSLCAAGERFTYVLQREARVSFRIYATNPQGQPTWELSWRPLDELVKPEGIHYFDVSPFDLPFGDFAFVFSAESTTGSDVETFQGKIKLKPTIRDTLPIGQTIVRGVNMFSGNLTVSAGDLEFSGRGPTLAVTRTYSSNDGNDFGSFGRGWFSDLDTRITFNDCGEVFVEGAQGNAQSFGQRTVDPDGGAHWVPSRGFHGALVERNGQFDFYAKDGTRYHFELRDDSGYRLGYVEDTNGNRLVYEYSAGTDGLLRVSRMIDSAGRQINVAYEARDVQTVEQGYAVRSKKDLVVELRAPDGIISTYQYDEGGNLLDVVRGQGSARRHWRYQYIDLGGAYFQGPGDNYPRWVQFGMRLESSRDAVNGATSHFVYSEGISAVGSSLTDVAYIPTRVIKTVTEPNLAVTAFAYTGTRGLGAVSTIVTDPRNHDTVYDMDRYGAVTRMVDPAGTTTTEWNYDHLSPAVITDRLGRITRRSYDAQGNMTLERIEHPSAGNLEQRWGYKAPEEFSQRPFIKNRLDFQVDARNQRTDFTYDPRGNLLTQSKGGVTESWTYLANGDVSATINGEGERTRFQYDDYGNQIRIEAADGGVKRRTFDVRGRLLTETDELSRVTDYSYDELDRLLEARLPRVDGESIRPVIRVQYRDADNARIDTDALGRNTTTYTDQMGRVVRIVLPPLPEGPAEILRTYDANGNLVLEVDPMLRETRMRYDASNRMELRTEPLDRQTAWTYDAEGHVLTQRTSLGADQDPRVVRYEYAHPLYKTTKTERLLRVDNGDTWLRRFQEYDGNGNMTASTDARGNRTTIEYDGRDREERRVEPLQKVTLTRYDRADRKLSEERQNPTGSGTQLRSWTYDDVGRVLSETDAEGGVRSQRYDLRGNRIERTDALGHIETFAYDARDRLIEQRNVSTSQLTQYGYDAKGNRTLEVWPGGRRLSQTYDSHDRPRVSSDQFGTIETLEYDVVGNVWAKVDGINRRRSYTYDELNRPLTESVADADGQIAWSESRTYTIHGELASRTDGLSNTTTFGYDSVGRKASQTAPAPLSFVQHWGYDADDHVLLYTDGRQLEHRYTYDELGRKTLETDPAGSSGSTNQRWEYDALGNVLRQTDRMGIDSAFSYDLENRPLTRTRDGERKLTQAYDDQGNLVTETDANGHITRYEYDGANRRTRVSRPEGVFETYTYTPDGDIATRTDALNRLWRNEYDVRRRLTLEVNAAREPTEYGYDLANRKTSTRRPLLQAWAYTFDAADRLTDIRNPLGQLTHYGYDRAGNRTLIRNARSHEITQSFDALNRRSSRSWEGGAAQRWTYDANGNVTREETPNGAEILSSYDELNRRTARTLTGTPTAGGWRETRYSYDANGKVLTETTETQSEPAWTRTRTYDRQDRLIAERDGDNPQLAYTYDAQGNRLTLTDAAGEVTRYGYDAANRLTSVSAPGVGATTYAYDTASQLRGRTGQGGLVTDYGYDDAGRIASITHRIGSTPTLSIGYTHNANGNRVQQVVEHAGSAAETTDFEYDEADRLVRSRDGQSDTRWTLDAAGNRTFEEVREGGVLTRRTAYTVDVRDRLRTATPELPTGPPTEYAYDANGNLLSETTGSAVTTYRWDARDRLIEQTLPGQAAIQNRYDDADRRIARSDGASGSRYRWDGNALLEETNAVGNRLTRYHRGAGLIGASSAGESRLYLTDSQNTPLALLRTDGAISGRAQYDIWGKTRSESGEQSKLGFTGYQKERGDLYQAVARYYRPGSASFLSIDPWEGDYNNPASLNKYLYGYGNPGTFVDPDGRCAEPATAFLCASGIAIAAGWAYNYIENSLSENQEIRESPAFYATTRTADQAVTVVGAGVTAAVLVETGGTAALLLGGARQTGLAGLNAAIAVNAPRAYGAVEGSIALGVGVATGAELPQIIPTYYPRTIIAANSSVLDDELRAMQPVIRQSEIPVPSPVRYEIIENAGEAGIATERRSSTLDVLDCCARCFGAGTLVMTADGLRPIESVGVGQRVMARDEVSGQTALRTVEHVIVRSDRVLFDLTFADGNKQEVISVTADHRFHTSDRGWVVSAELKVGETIDSLDGRRLVFVSRSTESRIAPTYNLSVAEDHNYFVGESGLWVHNCTPCGGGNPAPPNSTPLKGAQFGSDPRVFTNRAIFSASTGRNYTVYQRNDIDWSLVRTSGAREAQGITNLEAAQLGFRPQLTTGNAPEFATLHHSQQSANGPWFEASTRYHNISNAKAAPLHPFEGAQHPHYPLGRGPGSRREEFQTIESPEYWKWRAEREQKGDYD